MRNSTIKFLKSNLGEYFVSEVLYESVRPEHFISKSAYLKTACYQLVKSFLKDGCLMQDFLPTELLS